MVSLTIRSWQRGLVVLAALSGLPSAAACQVVTASVVPPESPAVLLATFEQPGGRPIGGDVEVRTANVLFCRESGATLLLARDRRNEVTAACPFVLMVVLDDERLVVSLDQGEVLIESDRPTGVGAGDSMIGTGRTHYVVRRDADEEGDERVACSVFEGTVVAQISSGTLAIEQGQAWVVERRQLESPAGNWKVISEVAPAEYQRAASLYTKVAVEMTRASGGAVTEEHESRLRAGYLEVLRKPADPEARVRLKELQVRGGFSVPASGLEVVPPEALERDPNLSVRLLSAEAVRLSRSGEVERAVDMIRGGAAPAAEVVETLRTYEAGQDTVAIAARRLRSQLRVAPP